MSGSIIEWVLEIVLARGGYWDDDAVPLWLPSTVWVAHPGVVDGGGDDCRVQNDALDPSRDVPDFGRV